MFRGPECMVIHDVADHNTGRCGSGKRRCPFGCLGYTCRCRMTPSRNRIARQLTAALVATVAISLLMLGFDGFLRGMHTLTRIYFAPRAAPPPPATEVVAAPGVVPAFVVPPEDVAAPAAAPADPAGLTGPVRKGGEPRR